MKQACLITDYSVDQLDRGMGMRYHPYFLHDSVLGDRAVLLGDCEYCEESHTFRTPSILFEGGLPKRGFVQMPRISDGSHVEEGEPFPDVWTVNPYTGEILKGRFSESYTPEMWLDLSAAPYDVRKGYQCLIEIEGDRNERYAITSRENLGLFYTLRVMDQLALSEVEAKVLRPYPAPFTVCRNDWSIALRAYHLVSRGTVLGSHQELLSTVPIVLGLRGDNQLLPALVEDFGRLLEGAHLSLLRGG